jgi:hypothetical protein
VVDKSVVGEDAFVVLRAKRGEAAIDTEPAANEGAPGPTPIVRRLSVLFSPSRTLRRF